MNKCSNNYFKIVFGLFFSCLIAFLNPLLADDNEKDKKKKKDDGLVGEPEVSLKAGLGEFDWTGKKNNYQKSTETVRKPANKELESKIICPSCNKEITVLSITASRIAIDYDFCEHYIGDSPYVFDLWCCSLCGYTAYLKSFGKPISEEDKVFVKKYLKDPLHKEIKEEFGSLLKELGSKPLSQKVIPAIAKVKNFVSYIDHRNDLDDQWKAFYYVRSIYAIRNLIAMAPSCTSLSNAFFEITKKVDSEVKIPEADKQMPHVSEFYLSFYLYTIDKTKENSKERLALHFLISQCFNRLGYFTESKNHFNKANEICSKLKDVDDVKKILNTHGELLELEKSYSLKAITYMKDALEQKADYGANQTAIIYLIGELSRRCEMYAEAYLFLSASKMLFTNKDLIYGWLEEHLNRKEFKNDDFRLQKPPAYLKQIVLDHNK